MNKSTIIEEMQQIRRLRIMGTPHDQIKKRLKLSNPQYAKRVANINKIDKEYIENEFHEELGSEILNTKGRIESVIRMCDRMMSDDNSDPFARLDAGRLTIHCSIELCSIDHTFNNHFVMHIDTNKFSQFITCSNLQLYFLLSLLIILTAIFKTIKLQTISVKN